MTRHSKITAIVLLTALSFCFCTACAFALGKPAPQEQMPRPSADIRLNSLGYLPDAQKKATIISKCSKFYIKDSQKNKTVYSGQVTGPFSQEDVNQTVWIADFSNVSKPGSYYIAVPGVGNSYVFEIGDGVYDDALKTAMRAFYLWRCGTAVEADYNGKHFSHAACHTDDAWLDYIGEPNTHKDGTAGWHDAGDYNKYVVNAGVTVASLVLAWEDYEEKLKSLDLEIPDTAPGYPDWLKELKWEYDWLFKMQFSDGSGKVSHKLSALKFCAFIMPEDEKDKRYFTDYSTPATAQFVAMMAIGARIFQPYDPDYAQKCLDAAKVSYEFLRENRDYHMIERGVFRTGHYPTPDEDDRMWAAVEMWETTGEEQYRRDFERGTWSQDDKINLYWDWNNVKNLAMFRYLMSEREGKREGLAADIKNDLLTTADILVLKAKKDVYGRCISEYRWGCNGGLARMTITLMMANKVSPNPEYVNTVRDTIDHIFGRNYYGRSYVTGLGYKPPMRPHDRRSGADRVNEPWPGYIVGGGHSATDWRDVEQDATTNEVCINWQAALVYALAVAD